MLGDGERDRRLQELCAKQDITELVYRYALAVDTRDWALMESLWVSETEPLEPPWLNIHTARRLPQAFVATKASVLFVGNHLIDLDGPDHAHGWVYCLCSIDRGQFFDQAIVYQDFYERHAGKWLFLKRHHLLWWGQERQLNPMSQPPANWPASQVGAGVAFDLLRRTGKP